MYPLYNVFSLPSQNDFFKIGVTIEIRSDEAIRIQELEEIITTALDTRRIDNLTVERDHFYELIAITGNFIRIF